MSVLTLDDMKRFQSRPTLFFDGCSTLETLNEVDGLEVLHLRHFPKIHSLEPLARLSTLRFLSLSTTPGWDGSNRFLTVDSFEPLVFLRKLELLQIIAVVPANGRLAPLSRIPSLKKVIIGGNFYQLEDFAALSVSLVKARESLRPVCQTNLLTICPKCQKYPLLFIEGAKPRCPRFVCPDCGRKKIHSHLERWNQAGGVPKYTFAEDVAPEVLIKEFGNPYAK